MKTLKAHTKENIIDNNEPVPKNDKGSIFFNKILKSNLIFIIGIILLLYKSLLLNMSIGLEIKAVSILYAVLASLLIMCPTINHRDKFSFIYLNVVYLILSIIIYSDYLYYSYSTNFLSFYQVENIKYAKDIGSGLLTIITFQNIFLYLFDNIIIALISRFYYAKFEKCDYSKNKTKTIIILIIIAINIFAIKTKLHNIYLDKIYNKSLMVQDLSIYFYHYEDFKDYFSSLFGKEPIDENLLSSIYSKNLADKPSSTTYTGLAKDSNVIIIQLESMSSYMIGKTVNGKEITPNLNKFFSENIYCSNMYNQGLGTTADSEFEMENSMYPLENGYVFQKYYNNNWLDIYTTLRNYGYHTSFMHPNTGKYWNRDEVYNYGYNIDEYHTISSFSNIEKAGEFYSDESFFDEAINIIDSYEGKFCTTLITVTTHIPFELTGISDLENKLTLTEYDLVNCEHWIFKNYVFSCNFADFAFGKFLNELESRGILDDTILVVYGDHGSGIAETDVIKDLYIQNNLDYTEFEHIIRDIRIPFGIKIPNVYNSNIINSAVSKIDIKPTILDLLGLDDNFSLGVSIFSGKDYSFIKGLGFVTSNYFCFNDKYYNRYNLAEVYPTRELDELLEKMKNEIYLSDMIIKNNLIK